MPEHLTCATVGLACALATPGRAGGLEALKRVMAPMVVRMEHKVAVKEGSAKVPPRRDESWRFLAGGAKPIVRYSRYLNQPPEFNGTHPSLPSHDVGIGFDSGPFGNWYRGNAIRLLLNGQDVFAQRPADSIEAAEGDIGRLRFLWRLDDERSLTLDIAVPDDGHAIYARASLRPPDLPAESMEVVLTCYPGGYGPAHRLPSHRWVVAPGAEADIPKDYVKTAGKDWPTVLLSSADPWVFYADKLEDKGALGLLALPEEGAAGEVRLSNYGQRTVLRYPRGTHTCRLAFFAFGVTNAAAKTLLLRSRSDERQALRTLTFWPMSEQPHRESAP